MRCFFCLVVTLLFSTNGMAGWLKKEADIMGTRIVVELYHQDPAVAQQGVQTVLAEMRRIDAAMSPFIDSSELSLVNREAAQQPVKISAELFRLLRRANRVSTLTHGAFDITFASVGYLYDYRRGIRPDDEQRARATTLVNYHQLQLNEVQQTVHFVKSGMRIDLGGIAKGYAVDRCMELLEQLDIHNALVRAGGDSRVSGERWGRPWSIGVRDPRDREGVVAVIPLVDVAVSTSGDYERFFERDGVRYHHIINPRTGDSARELQSATIIGSDATTTDALSTSVFVLGLQDGMKLINRLPGIDAILVDNHGALHYSNDLEPARNLHSGVNGPSPAVAP
ncbi:thiamine biosynthesis lipoprotein [Thiogranum longum]|uniref:FAD:protein FMN transferase n=1 Tax=Thiogranum longum TaxID=1537524 RepID=A0A4V2PGJ1_9GAMM|nr:FAD:protein FMN transferase [Thiogranum longum]TCK17056.1 thiamine biosynthesis lipoprotein [Thiogranum longum]